MYIIIVGAGEVGSYLARILVEEHHDVAVIDSDEKLVRELDASLDALVVHGTGVSQRSMRQAGIDKADLVLAVTHVDEVNLVACMTAAKCGHTRTVARVRQGAYLFGDAALDADELGLSLLVSPERAVASEVVNLLSYEGSGGVHQLADGQVVLLELPLSADSPLANEVLASMRDLLPHPSLVVAIQGAQGIRIPRGDDMIRTDERATILTVPDNVGEFWILSGKPWHHVRHVLIIGCGNIGFHLARELEQKGLYPTIIELDRERAEWVSQRLPKSIVLQGDGTDPDLLREQLEERADAVVVLLEDDEKAVLVGLFCKHLGAKKVIVRSDKPAYTHIAYKLGVDALLSPKRAVGDEILHFVRKGWVESAYSLGDHEGEILNFRVPDKPANDIVDKPLRDIDFPSGALLGVVVRDGAVSIATGGTVLKPGDDLLVACVASAVPRVEELFR